MMRFISLKALCLGVTILFMSGCGDDPSAVVQASLTNAAAGRALFDAQGIVPHWRDMTGERNVFQDEADKVPGYFGLKIVAIYITPDIDPDTGVNINPDGTIANSQGIYAAPECFTADGNGQKRISDGKEVHFGICDLETGGDSGAVPPVAVSQAVTTYIDLAATDVNDQLNAEQLSILPGTYKYVRIAAAGAAGGKVAGGAEGTANTVKVWHSRMGGTVDTANVEFRDLYSKDVALGEGGAGITITAGRSQSICNTI